MDPDEKAATQPLQQMIARHLLEPNTAIPTDNAKLRAAVCLPISHAVLMHCSARPVPMHSTSGAVWSLGPSQWLSRQAMTTLLPLAPCQADMACLLQFALPELALQGKEACEQRGSTLQIQSSETWSFETWALASMPKCTNSSIKSSFANTILSEELSWPCAVCAARAGASV